MAKKKSKVKASPSPIRDAIRAEIKARKLSGYQVAEALRGKVSRTAVYRFLADGGTTDVATAEAFMNYLDLRID